MDSHFCGGGLILLSLFVLQNSFYKKMGTSESSALGMMNFNADFSLAMCPCIWLLISGLSNLLIMIGVVCFSLMYCSNRFLPDGFDFPLWCRVFFFLFLDAHLTLSKVSLDPHSKMSEEDMRDCYFFHYLNFSPLLLALFVLEFLVHSLCSCYIYVSFLLPPFLS